MRQEPERGTGAAWTLALWGVTTLLGFAAIPALHGGAVAVFAVGAACAPLVAGRTAAGADARGRREVTRAILRALTVSAGAVLVGAALAPTWPGVWWGLAPLAAAPYFAAARGLARRGEGVGLH